MKDGLQSPGVSTQPQAATAKLETGPPGSECLIKIGGDWRLSGPVPSWSATLEQRAAASVRVVPEGLGKWDTSLVLFLVHGRAWCAQSKHDLHAEALPEKLQTLLKLVAETSTPGPIDKPIVRSSWDFAAALAGTWASHAKVII